ncbi:copper resistance protein CopC [Rhizobium sp. CG5]|uniref:copper resistance CopC/CopD family protein n=1 Tax=Rhizobium sp. CG5 TaxID=2726076 RepID=UPI00203433B4|nr:CopD family protein [Rhizobium sp. CG5]MCM2474998.1 copper resistance protein CopC [Rhizobium sp. CG5]
MALVAALLSLACVGAAFAHASLIASEPSDGAVEDMPPRAVTLHFSEPVRPLVARLTRPAGRTDLLRDIGEKGNAILLTLPADLEQGTYILSWRVASSDGHPIGGGLVFSVGAPSAVAPVTVQQADIVVRSGLWASRLIFLLSLVLGVGGTVFTILLGRGTRLIDDRVTITLTIAGLLATPILIGFQGLDVLGEPVFALLQATTWSAGLFATSFGHAALLGATAVILAYAARSIQGGRTAKVLASVALLVVGVAAASAGHAATASPVTLTKPALFLHVVTATLWIGALIPLGRLLLRGGNDADFALKRFSTGIPAVIGILVLSGIVLAVVQLQSFAALWTTAYGLVLVAKLVLVAGLLALGAFNRFWLTGPVLAGSASAARHLRRSIVVEVVLGCLVLGVLGLWRFTPPPRSLAAATAQSQEIRSTKDGLTAILTLTPAVPGPAVVEIRDLQLDGKPVDPLSVEIELGKPSYGIGPFTQPARRIDDQRFRAEGFVLPLDGFWVVRATVLVTEFRSITLTDIFDVTPRVR